MTTKRWLITGGCGFIGSSLVQKIKKNYPNDSIRVVDNLSVGTLNDLREVCDFSVVTTGNLPALLSTEVQFIKGDIRDRLFCEEALAGTDTLVHLAANTGVPTSVEKPFHDMECNVIGTLNILEASRINKVKKVIFASSSAPLGLVDPPIHEEMAAKPLSPYGASKLAGEGYCSVFGNLYGIKTSVLRFGNVYGPRSKNKGSVVAKYIKRIINNETLEIYGDGSQKRDYIYIDDLLHAIVLCSEKEHKVETFQIATSNPTTIIQLIDGLKKVVEGTDFTLSYIHKEERLGDIKDSFVDISKARRVIGYDPKTDFIKGLEKTFGYFLGLSE